MHSFDKLHVQKYRQFMSRKTIGNFPNNTQIVERSRSGSRSKDIDNIRSGQAVRIGLATVLTALATLSFGLPFLGTWSHRNNLIRPFLQLSTITFHFHGTFAFTTSFLPQQSCNKFLAKRRRCHIGKEWFWSSGSAANRTTAFLDRRTFGSVVADYHNDNSIGLAVSFCFEASVGTIAFVDGMTRLTADVAYRFGGVSLTRGTLLCTLSAAIEGEEIVVVSLVAFFLKLSNLLQVSNSEYTVLWFRLCLLTR